MPNTKVLQQLEQIAKTHLRVETLTVRNSDSLDFYDIGISSIADALKAAYELGRKEGASAAMAYVNEALNSGDGVYRP